VCSGLRKPLTGVLVLIATGLAIIQPISLRDTVPAWTIPTHAASENTKQDIPPVRLLTLDQRIDREFSSGETHAYEITLNDGQYLRVAIEQSGISLGGVLSGPNRRQLVEFRCRERGKTPMSLVAEGAGTYHLKIRSLQGGSIGRYVLMVESIRSGTELDQARVTAERAFAAAELLRAEWREESYRKAIEQYEVALQVWKSTGERQEQANTLKALGDAWQSLSESQKALKRYTEALSLHQQTNNRRNESELVSSIGYAYFSLGHTQRALESGFKALQLGREFSNRYDEARAFDLIGEAHAVFGNVTKALESYQQALSVSSDLKDPQGQALALLHSGHAYSDLSETNKALESYNQALPLWRTSKNPQGEALTITGLGHLFSKLGEKQKALGLYDQATYLFKTVGDKTGQASVFNGLGYVYEELGEKQKALQNYMSALTLFQSIGNRFGEEGSLYKIGKVYFSLKNIGEALNYYEQSRQVSRAIADKRMEAVAVGLIGQVFASSGDKKNALKHFNQALLLNKAGGDRREEAYSLNNIALIYKDLGEKQKALGYYSKALSLNRLTGDRFGESSTRYGIALIKRDLGKLEDAHAEMTEALALAESLRTNVVSSDLRLSYAANLRQAFELQIDILMQMHQRDPRGNFNSLGFEISERARARALLDSLSEAQAQIRQGADRVLLEKETQIEEQLSKKADEGAQLMAAGNNAETERVTKEISQLTTQYDEVKSEIRISNPHYAALRQPQPLSLKDVQQRVLDDNSVLLEYALGDQQSYLWAVTKDECWSYSLPGRTEIEKLAGDVYKLVTAHQPVAGETIENLEARVAQANEQLPAAIFQLSTILLDPVADRLGTKRLLIVSDGALQYVPFQILTKTTLTDAADRSLKTTSRRALVEDHELINQPSASALALLLDEGKTRTAPSGSVAVFADPVFEFDDPRISPSSATPSSQPIRDETAVRGALRDVGVAGASSRIPRLQASRDEAEAIMSAAAWWSGYKATGFEASRATAMKAELGNYRIVHFATHGLLNSEHPELSGIVLSLVDEKGQPQDGFLRLHDIYNLNLPVDLVVLSACNTALGKDVRGEGLIGLTRGFMYAGASSVVASLWKVDDDATAELMKLFYAGMLQEELSPAAALRKAQLAMSKQKRWQSPYYWSGFIIQGQYAQPQRPLNYSWRKSVMLVGVAMVLTLLAFFIWKRRRSRVH
jgi:CHAT domain-containing protein/tetratricopeptide (TPR) repeat protein